MSYESLERRLRAASSDSRFSLSDSSHTDLHTPSRAERLLSSLLQGGWTANPTDRHLPHVLERLDAAINARPTVTVSPRRVPQGSIATVTVQLPPPAFAFQSAVRTLSALLSRASPVEASFHSTPLVTFPSASSPRDTFHAFVPVTANDQPNVYRDVSVRVRSSPLDRPKTFLLPIQPTPRDVGSENLWFDPEDLPSTSPRDMTTLERARINRALRSDSDLASSSSSSHPPASPDIIGVFQKPCAASVSTRYGIKRKYNGIEVPDYFHEGIDLDGDYGDKVLNPSPGRVVLVALERQGFKVHGNCVIVDHGRGLKTLYAHLGDVCVSEGQLVESGHCLGLVGSTGLSTGPHLHWGTFCQGRAVDPELLLAH